MADLTLIPGDAESALHLLCVRLGVDGVGCVTPEDLYVPCARRIDALERRAQLSLEVARDPHAALLRVGWEAAETWLAYHGWQVITRHDDGTSWRCRADSAELRLAFVRRGSRAALSTWALRSMAFVRNKHRVDVIVELLQTQHLLTTGEWLG